MPAKKSKDVLAIMLGGKGKPPVEDDMGMEEEYPEEEEGEYGDAFAESAESAFGAIAEGNVDSFTSSLKDAIVTCLEEQGIE